MKTERIILGLISTIIGILLLLLFYKNKSKKEEAINIGSIMEYKGYFGAIGFIILGIVMIINGILSE